MNLKEELEAAIAEERLFVRVGRDYFLAIVHNWHDFGDGKWAVFLHAGPARRRGYITNIDDNAGGRDYIIAPRKETEGENHAV